MFGLFGQVKMVFTIIMLLGVAGASAYVLKLRGDNAILKVNQVKMEQALEQQTKFIEQQKKDYEAILKANQEVNKLVGNLKKDIDDLDKRFNKGTRDLGKTAMERPDAIERIVNKASDKALRCVEIAGGAPLTEQEKNATKKSEINSECPALANPRYKPYND
jgi:predicted  nucleic acid-binding Zn-ribbon protein